MLYILIDKLVVPEPDTRKWAEWIETHDRHVAATHIGPVYISTVFLGIDHSFGKGLPILFETMIFKGGSFAEHGVWRYESWGQAEAGHAAAVAKVRAEIKDKVND